MVICSITELKIIFTVPDKLRQVLLREYDITLCRAIQIYRFFHSSGEQSQQMQVEDATIRKVSSNKQIHANEYEFDHC